MSNETLLKSSTISVITMIEEKLGKPSRNVDLLFCLSHDDLCALRDSLVIEWNNHIKQ